MRLKRSMFNAEQKQEYIDYEQNNSITLTNYFKRLSKNERELNKDIADMNVDELKLTFMSLHIRREETIGQMLSLMRGYIDWAILSDNSKGGSAIDKITAESIFSQEIISLQMIESPEHLESILKNTLDEVDYENRTKRDSLVFWLIYSGIDIKKLENLKKTDINIEQGIVKTDDGECYEVYKQVFSLWNHCVNANYLEKRNGKSKEIGEYTSYELVDSDYLFRPILGKKLQTAEKCNVNTFMNIVSKTINAHANKDKRIKIPPANIRNSGIFYKLFLLEKQGIEISLQMLAKYLEIKYDKDNLSVLMRKWRIDYENWKLAFGLI